MEDGKDETLERRGAFLAGALPVGSADSDKQPARIPEQLSEHYHKARRNLVLASALLLAWSAVGLGVSEVSTEGAKLTIAHPEYIPLVLRATVTYFFIRTWLEFLECDPERVKRWSPRVDVWMSTVLAGAALVSPWFWQYWWYTAWAAGASIATGIGYAAFRTRQELLLALNEVSWGRTLAASLIVSGGTVGIAFAQTASGDTSELLFMFATLTLSIPSFAIWSFLSRRIRQESKQEAEQRAEALAEAASSRAWYVEYERMRSDLARMRDEVERQRASAEPESDRRTPRAHQGDVWAAPPVDRQRS